MFIPRFSAYLTPSRSAFRGFTMNNAKHMEIIIKMENDGNWSSVTLEKFPIPHITNACTPSSVAKKFSNEIALEVK